MLSKNVRTMLMSNKNNKKLNNILGDEEVTSIFDYFMKMLPGVLYYKDKHGKYIGCSDYLVTSCGYQGKSDIVWQPHLPKV